MAFAAPGLSGLSDTSRGTAKQLLAAVVNTMDGRDDPVACIALRFSMYACSSFISLLNAREALRSGWDQTYQAHQSTGYIAGSQGERNDKLSSQQPARAQQSQQRRPLHSLFVGIKGDGARRAAGADSSS